ncbi:hypothetical protein IM317_23515, partial [Enterobacter cloacae complex sp. S3]|nr:hypothetical protein [Enterobacter cloacae complex sp. S3]
VKEIKINTGDKVSTGSLIMVFEVAIEVNVPDIGGDEVEVTEILVKVGDTVAAEQSLITVEGDKASMEVPAPFAGTVKDVYYTHLTLPTTDRQ